MDEPIQDYGSLVDAMKARRQELGMTLADVDARAGFHDGYTAKLEAWRTRSGRGGISPTALALWLGALGLAIDVYPVSGPMPEQERHAGLNRRMAWSIRAQKLLNQHPRSTVAVAA